MAGRLAILKGYLQRPMGRNNTIVTRFLVNEECASMVWKEADREMPYQHTQVHRMFTPIPAYSGSTSCLYTSVAHGVANKFGTMLNKEFPLLML